MTYNNLINTIEAIAKEQPNVNTIVSGDVYKLNGLADAIYSVFAWQAVYFRDVFEADERHYRLQLFYIDRLTSNEANEVSVQSVGTEVLNNVIRTMVNYYDLEIEDEIVYYPFTQRFNDLCSGVYCEVTFKDMMNNECEEIY